MCLIHAAHPILTPSCRKGQSSQIVIQSGKESYVLTVLALMLGAWFGVVAMCTIFCCIKRKTAALSRKGKS